MKELISRALMRLWHASHIAVNICTLQRICYGSHGKNLRPFPFFLRLLTDRHFANRWWDWVGDMRDYYGDDNDENRLSLFTLNLDDEFEFFMTI